MAECIYPVPGLPLIPAFLANWPTGQPINSLGISLVH